MRTGGSGSRVTSTFLMTTGVWSIAPGIGLSPARAARRAVARRGAAPELGQHADRDIANLEQRGAAQDRDRERAGLQSFDRRSDRGDAAFARGLRTGERVPGSPDRGRAQRKLRFARAYPARSLIRAR